MVDVVVVGLLWMNVVFEIDFDDRFIWVQVGCINLLVLGVVDVVGFFYVFDFFSQLVCVIGGNIGMNFGGVYCLKYGVIINNLLGVIMVMMDGSVVELGGLMGEVVGLDLLGVVCGLEGQFGIVIEVMLCILFKLVGVWLVLVGFDVLEIVGVCVVVIICVGVLFVVIEFMDCFCICVIEVFVGVGYFDCEVLLIIEVEGSLFEIDEQLVLICGIVDGFVFVEFCESWFEDEFCRIWLGCKLVFGVMGQINDYMCFDGIIFVSMLFEVLVGIVWLLQEFGLDVVNVFYVGDGNMYLLIFYNVNIFGDLECCEVLGVEILKLCVQVGGCLIGEYGVGVEKCELMIV